MLNSVSALSCNKQLSFAEQVLDAKQPTGVFWQPLSELVSSVYHGEAETGPSPRGISKLGAGNGSG